MSLLALCGILRSCDVGDRPRIEPANQTGLSRAESPSTCGCRARPAAGEREKRVPGWDAGGGRQILCHSAIVVVGFLALAAREMQGRVGRVSGRENGTLLAANHISPWYVLH